MRSFTVAVPRSDGAQGGSGNRSAEALLRLAFLRREATPQVHRTGGSSAAKNPILIDLIPLAFAFSRLPIDCCRLRYIRMRVWKVPPCLVGVLQGNGKQCAG